MECDRAAVKADPRKPEFGQELLAAYLAPYCQAHTMLASCTSGVVSKQSAPQKNHTCQLRNTPAVTATRDAETHPSRTPNPAFALS
eukprot:669122-Amphidinium_carterae.2